MNSPLDYLDFEYSEDDHGQGTFDAMASVLPAHVPALHAELTQVLAWACDTFGPDSGPLDEGCDWDYDLQLTDDTAAQGRIGFEPSTRSLCVQMPPGAASHNRHTVTLTLGGTPAFCAAFQQVFVQD